MPDNQITNENQLSDKNSNSNDNDKISIKTKKITINNSDKINKDNSNNNNKFEIIEIIKIKSLNIMKILILKKNIHLLPLAKNIYIINVLRAFIVKVREKLIYKKKFIITEYFRKEIIHENIDYNKSETLSKKRVMKT